jgi:protein ImuB
LLESLPVALLTSVQPHLPTLESIGCQTIGQLHRLPRSGVTRRFGRDVLMELDCAFGVEPEVHAWFEPPLTFCAQMELPARVESAEALLFAARRLLMQMTGWLVARHAAVSRLSLLLQHERTRHGNAAATRVVIALGSPSRELPHLTLLLQEHLGRVALSASVIGLTLQAEDIVALAAPNSELFPAPASQAESMGRLIERLASRLGSSAVNRLAVVADHRPERCSTFVPAGGMPTKGRMTELPHHAFPTRPTWLLPQPIPLLLREHKPFYQGSLTLLAGPERIEAGWWDDALAARDYYIACNDSHALLWIYRERPGAERAESGWFLHGFFG